MRVTFFPRADMNGPKTARIWGHLRLLAGEMGARV